VKAPKSPESRIQLGDVVIVPSTDYRDLRKAAYQQYSIASAFNTIRLPKSVSINSGSILGVAFVSAALALGVCMGINFDSVQGGPNLLSILQSIEPDRLATDVRGECLGGIGSTECARAGNFLVIWGGSSTCAFVAKQLARLAGLKIISVVDSAKHGLRLSGAGVRPDLIVDSHHPERAIEIIKSVTKDRPSFGFDTQGKETAVHLIRALAPPFPTVHALIDDATKPERKGNKFLTPPSTPLEVASRRQHSHVVGLTGLPKSKVPEHVALHNVPIKVFHEIPEVGEALCAWCEKLLLKGLLVPPDVVGVVDGLGGINAGLDRMRRREVSGGRLIAVLR
jgi:NADPH:quinone reductase-like Zn-dependent oxidoreductase